MDDLDYIHERLDKQDSKLECLETKMDTVMEMVQLGKYLIAFAKLLGWVGGAYIACETYIRTVLHK